MILVFFLCLTMCLVNSKSMNSPASRRKKNDETLTLSNKENVLNTTSKETSTPTQTSTPKAKEILTKDICKNLEYKYNGTFRVYKVGFACYEEECIGNNEDYTRKLKCSIDDNNILHACVPWIKEHFSHVTLMDENLTSEIHGITRTDRQVDNVIFTINLTYEKHNKLKIRCVSKITDNMFLISDINQMGNIIEKHYVVLEPHEQTVIYGENITLTCECHTVRGLDLIKWYRTKFDGAKNSVSEVLCDNKKIHCTQEGNKEILTIPAEKNNPLIPQWQYMCVSNGNHVENPIAYAMVYLTDKDKTLLIASVSVCVGLFIIGIISTVVYLVRRRITQKNLQLSLRMTEVRRLTDQGNNYMAVDEVPLKESEDLQDILERIQLKHQNWECKDSSLQLKHKIGEGNFGYVMLGTMPDELGIIQTVAVKTLKCQGLTAVSLVEFEKEIDNMTNIRHKSIVNIVGICTQPPSLSIIMEYMENGQLNYFLEANAPHTGGENFTSEQLIRICYQPCDALFYLSSRNMLHRDVSARNCLVGSNLTVKLADFGLSRDTSENEKHYYKKEGGMVPVKWMAPEALTYGRYTVANDVWAFGVLMWEIFSYGAIPYQGHTNFQTITYISDGGRLDRPKACPQKLWDDVVTKCWIDAPDDRIMFSAILAFLSSNENG